MITTWINRVLWIGVVIAFGAFYLWHLKDKADAVKAATVGMVAQSALDAVNAENAVLIDKAKRATAASNDMATSLDQARSEAQAADARIKDYEASLPALGKGGCALPTGLFDGLRAK